MIRKCSCEHPAQDAFHGKGNRVHTTDAKGNHHCTVCGGPARMFARLVAVAKAWLPMDGK